MARPLALAAALLLTGAGAATLRPEAGRAQSSPSSPSGPQVLSPEQQNILFPGRKALLLEEQKGRIAILERSRSCVGRASTPEALSSCLMQERRDTMALRSRFRDQMRELFAKNGIPFPEMKRLQLRRIEPGSKGAQQSI